MLTKNMPKSRKAISPILATLLLIVIAVAAIVVTYAWVMTYMGSQTSQAGVLLSRDNVEWVTGETQEESQIKLYVRNTGTSDATIGAVYVGTSATNLANATIASMNPTNGVAAANGGVIQLTVTYNWTSGTTYYFRVAPKLGAPLEFNIKAP
jgi:flagellin-like protein